MKKSSTLLPFLLIAVAGVAQPRVAVLGGPHSATVKESNTLPGWEVKTKPYYTGRSGLNLGFLADLPLNNSGNLALQPGIFFMSKGRKFQQVFDRSVVDTDTINYRSSFFTNYIDIPFNLTLKLPMSAKAKFFLSAGPYISFYFSGKRTSELLVAPTDSTLSFTKTEESFEVGKGPRKLKTVDAGINGRVGFELGKVILSGFYSQGLSSFFEADYDGTFKHQVIGASIGFWLTKSNPKPPAPKAPKDSDKDGVPDNLDACPTLAGPAGTMGCPDRDGDGIADHADKCPGVAGVAAYQGCPVPDTDGDGVNDLEDKCPSEAGPAGNQGCPLPKPEPDTDGDGVIDKEDECPTEAGPASNKGCPVIRKEVIEKVNFAAHNILFERGSVKLDARSYPALDEVAAILLKHPKLRLEINGYTDNSGSVKANLDISQKRADAVKKYLNEKGIAVDRLPAKGHGPANPIADNGTEAGRVKNRRVELKLQE